MIIYVRPRPQFQKETLPEYDLLADLYDLEYVHDYDVPFWLALAHREGSPVVEWGAGTGRVAIPLTEEGFDVTAVEVSEKMVERGRSKSESVGWICGDMRSAKLDKYYKLAVCAFNSFLCLTSIDDALAFLGNAREHLEPGGLLGIEGFGLLAGRVIRGARRPRTASRLYTSSAGEKVGAI